VLVVLVLLVVELEDCTEEVTALDVVVASVVGLDPPLEPPPDQTAGPGTV
jgi:hypothetical protein